MPAKHRVKTYIPGGYYHSFNKGFSHEHIFRDDQDYQVFVAFLRSYLSAKESPHPLQTANLAPTRLRPLKNFHETIHLLAFALLPNHFHLLFQQKDEESMSHFMTSLATSYSMYFNKKYDRQGSLFQGRYKAVLIPNDNYLLHLSAYIHRDPLRLLNSLPAHELSRYAYSSYHNYLGMWEDDWIRTQKILAEFDDGQNSEKERQQLYKRFVEDYPKEFESLIKDLTIE